jgi:hypothetical protein
MAPDLTSMALFKERKARGTWSLNRPGGKAEERKQEGWPAPTMCPGVQKDPGQAPNCTAQ